ncbi:putative fad-binding domain-containing protein [Neofusicoccum parvum UCRNP2]|uniref:Putative fad-binding domain-containing protein n=1 Tax=Botryosphaeria parva (strain UCR-NP2) TaxID=1287680 RepID=R1EUS1_BOTPV|nr:putative fad-binding domain-containing protein [Neofusicoccum parvum UCRNP2]
MSPLSKLPISGLLLLAAATTAAPFDCLPGDPCWPSSRQWASFNSTLNGRLQLTKPLASPCYDGSGNHDPALCTNIAKVYSDDVTRASVYGATQNLQWQECGTEKCLLKSPDDGQCSLGALSAYYVNATNAYDVIQTVKFVGNTGIRMSIKNSGHDYLGRSVAPNSLALWTRNIQNYEFHESFTPEGCSTSYENIGVIGAGVSAGEARDYFKTKGMDITLGAIESVGPAGGFGQAGGHGPLGPTHGLMIDQAVEFDVVTADGVLRTINACQEPDLFWAMRGGGGGTFAVMVNYKFKVHPSVPFNTYSFLANLTDLPEDLTQSWVYRAILTAFVENQEAWSAANMSGYNFFSHDKIETHLVLPSNQPLAHMIDLTSAWADFLTSLPGLSITKHAYEHFKTYKDWASDSDYRGIINRNSPGGIAVVESGRLIPRSLFSSKKNQTQLVDGMLRGLAAGSAINPHFMMQVYATTPANTPDAAGATSAHPAWRTALWTLDYVSGYLEGTPAANVSALWQGSRDAVAFLKKLTPGGGCYLNEADYGEEDWQATFFGDNYARLLRIKNAWDPKGLFNCWKCVGWTGEADRMYSCYGDKPNPSAKLPAVGEAAGDGLKHQHPEGLTWAEELGFVFSEEL